MASRLTIPEVQALERRMFDAMIGDDTETLRQLLSDDLLYIHSAAVLQSKDEYLEWQQRRYEYQKIESSNAIYHFADGMAVVSDDTTMTMRVDDKPSRVYRLRVVYVWREEPGGWRLVFRQSSRPDD